MGPSASAGMNVSAPTMTMTPTSIAMKRGVCVGSVPTDAGTSFFFASAPASASTAILIQNRPRNIETPSITL